MSIWKYAADLPAVPPESRITLGEGQTPLVRSRNLGPALGLDGLYFKLENCNPTGSYKDRFAAMAVSDMLARGAKLCLATSSGNTGSALSAACAVAGIECYIAVVDGAPLNKLRNMQVYGAKIYSVREFGIDPTISADVMYRLRRLCEERGAALQISNYLLCPAGMAGCETIAYELAEELDGRVDHVFTQSGAGGMTLAVARGFSRLVERGDIARSAAVHSVQPEGNNTIAGPLREGRNEAQEVRCTTKVSGLQVPNVLDGNEVIAACRECGGNGHLVTDDDVYRAQARLAREEGIFSEPAGAVAAAGVIRAAEQGEITAGQTIVCTVTGIGFKDEPSLLKMVEGQEYPTLATPGDIDSFLPGG
ncbi:MAG: pyridoxal-phosphate dependent enzyme [Planctomycetaceae bacterium]|nr:pyridoxal-phosphate dependent enzyme [Planctomycetaceae bacterium]